MQDLEDATPEQMAEVEVIGAGGGLHWETLDVDFSVPGLVNGVFDTAKWMAARGGRAASPAKARRRGRMGPRAAAEGRVINALSP